MIMQTKIKGNTTRPINLFTSEKTIDIIEYNENVDGLERLEKTFYSTKVIKQLNLVETKQICDINQINKDFDGLKTFRKSFHRQLRHCIRFI